MAEEAARGPVPITLLTGFLGAGKSTLLGRILQEEHGMRVAVIQNEKENLGLERLTAVAEGGVMEEAQPATEWVDLPNGCACCTVKDDLLVALEQLSARGNFSHIVIELSGLADPSQLAQIFWADAELEASVYLDAIVCVVDARHIGDHLNATAEAPNQVAFADVILLNKCDLVSDSAVASTRLRLERINPTARILTTVFSAADLRELLNVHAFDPLHWQDTMALRRAEVPRFHHMEQICSELVKVEEPLDKDKFRAFLAELLWEKDEKKETYDVLRLKGLLSFRGKKRRVALQGVRETWQLEKTRLPNCGEPSLLVFIGRNLRIDEWKERLNACCK